jgi:hypothetical protein
VREGKGERNCSTVKENCSEENETAARKEGYAEYLIGVSGCCGHLSIRLVLNSYFLVSILDDSEVGLDVTYGIIVAGDSGGHGVGIGNLHEVGVSRVKWTDSDELRGPIFGAGFLQISGKNFGGSGARISHKRDNSSGSLGTRDFLPHGHFSDINVCDLASFEGKSAVVSDHRVGGESEGEGTGSDTLRLG